MSTIAIIPARLESKRLYRKNIRILSGKPLIYWTLETALLSKEINSIYVTTESEVIKKAVRKFLANCECLGKPFHIINRPEVLASDEASVIDVVRHVEKVIIAERESKIPVDMMYCLLYPTYPLRSIELVENVIKMSRAFGRGNTITVVEVKPKIYWCVNFDSTRRIKKLVPNEIYRSQDMETPYQLAGAVHCMYSADLANMDKNGMSSDSFGYVVSPEYSDQCLEVDDINSFIKAEQLLSNN